MSNKKTQNQRRFFSDSMKLELINKFRAGEITREDLEKTYNLKSFDLWRFERQLKKKNKDQSTVSTISVKPMIPNRAQPSNSNGHGHFNKPDTKDAMIAELYTMIAEKEILIRKLTMRLSRYETVRELFQDAELA